MNTEIELHAFGGNGRVFAAKKSEVVKITTALIIILSAQVVASIYVLTQLPSYYATAVGFGSFSCGFIIRLVAKSLHSEARIVDAETAHRPFYDRFVLVAYLSISFLLIAWSLWRFS